MGPAADSMPDLTGCVIDDRFQLLTMLGSGSFGVVYHAIDLDPLADQDRLDVAVKIISKASRTLSELEMVRREVALQAEVSHHQNVVQIYDAFEDNDYFYIVLDLCKGGDLYEQVCIKEVYAGKDELLRGAFLSLITAVQACHKARIFHRDLKPENIMTNEDGSEVYVADFGLATDKNVSNEHRVGTEGYMSPECLGSLGGLKPYCTRFGDIWALGVILVNMITGRQPWRMAEPVDECFAWFLTDPHMLMKSLPISDGVNAILHRIFVLNPLRRITLTELRRAILEVDTFFPEKDELAEYSAEEETAAASMQCGGQSSDEAVVGSIPHFEEGVNEDGMRSNLHSVKKARLNEDDDEEFIFLVAKFPVREDDESSISSASSRDTHASAKSSSVTPKRPPMDCKGACMAGRTFGEAVYQRAKRKRTLPLCESV
ncbi:kinase-like protein [Polyporus arcularius HHB13444]|uniref:Kinase-like protein n=1 Tax=Polyporus arcularius HHB13444 TaxID=1314778 RepID=A0A5C3PVX4_9APHY|nr:kinase-like protein [Polyporus arcularius HHB13444]